MLLLRVNKLRRTLFSPKEVKMKIYGVNGNRILVKSVWVCTYAFYANSRYLCLSYVLVAVMMPCNTN